MESTLRLSEIKPGTKAVIDKISTDSGDIGRLRDLGLNEGVAVRLVRYAPMGDPLEIKLHGFHLSLRKDLAKDIWVSDNK